jgi:hypothetical protein
VQPASRRTWLSLSLSSSLSSFAAAVLSFKLGLVIAHAAAAADDDEEEGEGGSLLLGFTQ